MSTGCQTLSAFGGTIGLAVLSNCSISCGYNCLFPVALGQTSVVSLFDVFLVCARVSCTSSPNLRANRITVQCVQRDLRNILPGLLLKKKNNLSRCMSTKKNLHRTYFLNRPENLRVRSYMLSLYMLSRSFWQFLQSPMCFCKFLYISISTV